MNPDIIKDVREALEPFGRLANAVFYDGRWSDERDDRAVWGFDNATITVGDLRRARTAYDRLSSLSGESETVPGGDGWVHWSGGDCPVPVKTEGLLRVEDGEVIYSAEIDTFNFAHGSCGPHQGRQIVAYRILTTPVRAEIDRVPAEAGEAGAGPVGEAVEEAALLKDANAWYSAAQVEEMLSEIYVAGFNDAEGKWHEGTQFHEFALERQATAIGEILTTKRDRAEAGPVGEAVAWGVFTLDGRYTNLSGETEQEACDTGEEFFSKDFLVRPFYARPVDEPGEVERQQGEIAVLASLLKIANYGRDTAEAALAEMRERLENVEAQAAANGRAGVEAAVRYVEALWHAHTEEFGIYDPETNATEFRGPGEDVDCLYQELIEGIRSLDADRVDQARAALSTQESSAALAGDEKEAGR